MPSPDLSRLSRVDVRLAWQNEATHFTPWLAQPNNLALLAEAMGLPPDALEVQAQEQSVGPFRADLLCRNNEDNSLVLIENQLERTDHGHLGQLITYAAGLKAVTLVWIAEQFREEHRAALDWLNEITDEGFHAFGLEIELWQIDRSPFAPKFNVVVQPNEWARSMQQASKADRSISALGQLQVAYWTSFGEGLRAVNSPLKPPKPVALNWVQWGLGRSGVGLLAFMNMGHVAVGLEVNSREHPSWFDQLAARRTEIEESLGFCLEWERKPENKFSTMRCRLALDMREEANWREAQAWMIDRLLKLRAAFRPLVTVLSDHPQPADSTP